MHWMFVYIRLAQYILWLTINFLFKAIQWIWWEWTGVASTMRQAAKNPFDRNAAQVLNIRGKFKVCEYTFPASIWDFLTTHDRFESPEYVLQDHITLYSISDKDVTFVETKPNQKLWDTKIYPPFLMVAQFCNAVKIVKMPAASLHGLAEKIGDPKGELIFLSNCARCGSTLVTQMFNATGKIVTFSEPNCLNFLSKAADLKNDTNNVENDRFERLTKNTIRLLCKQTQSGDEIAYVIKMCSPSIAATPLLVKLFPNSKSLYLYRNPIKVAQSLYRMSCSIYSVRMIYLFGKGSAVRSGKVMSFIGFPESYYRIRIDTNLGLGIGFYYTLTLQYLNCCKEVKNFPAIRYEDIIRNSFAALELIFRYCNLPLELIPKAMEAFNWDSQKGTALAAEVLRKFPLLPYEGEAKIECEKLAKRMGFPDPSEEYIIENTLTSKCF